MTLEDKSVEQSVLGAALLGGIQAEVCWLAERDFTDPFHRAILVRAQSMIQAGTPIDAITMCAELAAHGDIERFGPGRGMAYVHWLAGVVPTPASGGYYAEILRGMTRVRELRNVAARVQELCRGESAAEHYDEIQALLQGLLKTLPGVLQAPSDASDLLQILLSESDVDTDWLIPGFLARQDRAVIVAAEGVGKSSLLRQVAICAAAGLHPWIGEPWFPGRKILFIDAENNRNQSRAAYRWAVNRISRSGMEPDWLNRIVHKTRNDGVDLAKRDNAWFRDTVGRVQPDIVILSPAYKLMRGGDPKEDRDVMDLLDAIDQVRVAHDCAVLIESHAPYGTGGVRSMRPFGSSRWLAWPEVGIGYGRDESIPEQFQARRPEFLEGKDWRGMREDRDWPLNLHYGGPGQLPWVPTDDNWQPSVGPMVPA